MKVKLRSDFGAFGRYIRCKITLCYFVLLFFWFYL